MNSIFPKISIIVPVYNVEIYVSKCIESIQKQNYKNLEIIITNDGSTDKSGKICNYYAKQDNRIILINQENQGLSMARNNALDIASGEYIGFVDSDDWIESDMYYTLYNNAIAYNADISICNFKSIKESDENILEDENNIKNNGNKEIIVLEGFKKIEDNINNSINFVWNKLYKRHLFNNIRFPRGKVCEDVFITHKLIDLANKVVISPEYKYYYLLRNNGISLSPFNLKQMDVIEAYIERHKYISEKYPILEKNCRKYIFTSLLLTMNKAYMDNSIEINKNALLKIINSVRCYNFNDCGLSIEEKNTLKLLFTDIKSYVVGLRLYHNKLNNKDSNFI